MDINALGEELYSIVVQIQPELAPKLVGMLLQLGPEACAECLDSQEVLAQRLDEAFAILDQAGGASAVAPPAPRRAAPGPGGAGSEEKRIDPEDGLPRTYQELQKLCAGQYTKKEIDEYWAAMAPARPNAKAAAAPAAVAERPAEAAARSRPAPAAREAPRPAPPVAEAVNGDAPDAAAGCYGDDQGEEVVVGFNAWLEELRLAKYAAPAAAWIEEQGACNLEEIIENIEELADSLSLKPLERSRLLKGAAAAAQVALAAPRRQPSAAPVGGAGNAGGKAAGGRAEGAGRTQSRQEDGLARASSTAHECAAVAEELAQIERDMRDMEEEDRTRVARQQAASAAKAKAKAAPTVRVTPKATGAPAMSRDEVEWQPENERQEAEFRRKQQARLAERAADGAEAQQHEAADVPEPGAGADCPAEDFPALGVADGQAGAGKKGRKKRV